MAEFIKKEVRTKQFADTLMGVANLFYDADTSIKFDYKPRLVFILDMYDDFTEERRQEIFEKLCILLRVDRITPGTILSDIVAVIDLPGVVVEIHGRTSFLFNLTKKKIMKEVEAPTYEWKDNVNPALLKEIIDLSELQKKVQDE